MKKTKELENMENMHYDHIILICYVFWPISSNNHIDASELALLQVIFFSLDLLLNYLLTIFQSSSRVGARINLLGPFEYFHHARRFSLQQVCTHHILLLITFNSYNYFINMSKNPKSLTEFNVPINKSVMFSGQEPTNNQTRSGYYQAYSNKK